jgi:very-short-patch-repair endonuclease
MGGQFHMNEVLKLRSRELRKNLTDCERKLWRELRLRQTGNKFRRQFNIGPFIVDFCCPEKKVIVELDGGHHQNQMDYDANRTEWLESQGYCVLRFWNSDVEKNLEGVRQMIYRQLQLAPHLQSSPTKGGGGQRMTAS